MVNPNKFEKAILDAAVAAWDFHYAMTGGAYLHYTHESFLQNYIAVQLFKKEGFYVYVDPSPKKIRNDSKPGVIAKKPPKNLNLKQRFDLVIWLKTEDRVKAIIEVKRAWSKPPVLKDVKKISRYLKTKDGGGISGYVLYYTDARDSKYIDRRFQSVNDEMTKLLKKEGKFGLVGKYICKEKDWDPYGFALFRC